ncbi:MAG: hypothetical protein J3K34DRAFT_245913 [Monoraphidium minutum]|nr:MAG: hypothetical protein J3K34DRAFT_245913 [Monoraphidium minutum]
MGARRAVFRGRQRGALATAPAAASLVSPPPQLAARTEQAELDAQAALAAANAAAAGGAPDCAPGSPWCGGGGGDERGAPPSWGLHAAVAAAAAAVRWWLLNETDPVQRKIMLVILWPAAWVYGSMLLGCLPPDSPRLRRFFFCLAYVIIGYVARCAAERTLGAGAAAGAPHGAGGAAPRWPPMGDWGAVLHAHHHQGGGGVSPVMQ